MELLLSIFIILIIIIAVIFFSYRLTWGLYLIAILFPFINLQIIWGEINVPYVDIVAMLVFGGWLVYLARERKISKKYFPGLIFFLLFFASSLLSLINSADIWLSLKYILRPLSFFYLMFVVLPYNIIKNKQILLRILYIFYGLGIITAIMGLISIFTVSAQNVLAKRVVPIAIGGVYPLGAYHNQIAEVLIVMIPVGFLLTYLAKQNFHKKLFFLGTMLMVVINLLTFSRSAWIALFIELAVLVLIQYRHKLKNLLKPSLILLCLLLPLTIYMFIFSTQWQVDSSNQNRLMLMDIAIDVWQDFPLIGAGAGTFIDYVELNPFYMMEFGSALDAHGFVWKILPELGILGLITFLILFGYILYTIIKPYFSTKFNQTWSYIILSCLIMSIGSIAFQFFQTSYFLGRLWLPLGIALVTIKLAQQYGQKKT